jgi:hypothetical protein
MSIKQKPIHVCDYCGKEIDGNPEITTCDLPYEGSSEICIRTNKGKVVKSFEVGNADYCGLDCLFSHIKETLYPK